MKKPEDYTDLTLFYRGPFSQWHKKNFEEDGIIYNCCEQYMMYHKAILFNDRHTAQHIIMAEHPRAQKSLGRTISDFNNKTWDDHKIKIVTRANELKFGQNFDLKFELLGTAGTRLVEASPYDRIWGIGLDENNPNTMDVKKWRGQNLLGDVLTTVRDNLLV